MIVDARQASKPLKYRPYTAQAAVEIFLNGMAIGESKDISSFKDQHGNDLLKPRVDTLVSAVRENRRFTIRASKKDGIMCTVTRIT